ncbi:MULTISPECIES: tetratricopeptide repeat protein [Thermodesulfovibrio]|uniref:tetratricopeptide repeat protein n=1 Tax=Thermodesulfovibrio TaxID=28261 RepID=UPI00260FC595|nr:tetratricopeptide repeat protein [Thermodesulfovibrio sp.]
MRSSLKLCVITLLLVTVISCYRAPVEQPHRISELSSLILQANKAFERGDIQAAELIYKEAYKKARLIQDDNSSVIILISLSRLYSSLDKIEDASSCVESALRLSEKSSIDRNVEEEIIFERARIEFLKGKNDENSLKRLTKSESVLMRIKALNLLSRIKLRVGEPNEAENLIKEALSLNKNISRIEEANSWRLLGEIYSKGKHNLAEKYLLRALEIDKEIAIPEKIGLDMEMLGRFYSNAGEKRKAIEYFNRTLEIWRGLGNQSKEIKIIEEIKRLSL